MEPCFQGSERCECQTNLSVIFATLKMPSNLLITKELKTEVNYQLIDAALVYCCLIMGYDLFSGSLEEFTRFFLVTACYPVGCKHRISQKMLTSLKVSNFASISLV